MSEVAVDLVTAAHVRLSKDPHFLALVTAGLIGTDEDGTVWLFQGLDDDGRPFRDPEGSGSSVVVLSERREWTSPNSHNTAFFPSLQVLIYTDSSRNPDGAVTLRDADRKCKHIFHTIDRCFHQVGPRTDTPWEAGDAQDPSRVLYVHSILRGSGFDLQDVPGTQSATVRGEALYNAVTD